MWNVDGLHEIDTHTDILIFLGNEWLAYFGNGLENYVVIVIIIVIKTPKILVLIETLFKYGYV